MVKRPHYAVTVGVLLTSMNNVVNCLVASTVRHFTKQGAEQRTLSQASAINMIVDIPAESFISDPQLEAGLLNDCSHIAEDFTTFISPNTAWNRFFSVLGRVLVISSDYIPDHYISPDEALFQTFMLAMSIQMLLKSVFPVIKAASSKASLSVRDRRAFTQLFRAVDVSVLQFKTLLTSRALEWVELDHHDEVHLNGDHMYWLHSGDISSSFHDSDANTQDKTTLQVSNRMFGVVFFAKVLQDSMKKDSKKRTKLEKVKVADDSSKSVNHETLVAGPNGAIVLKICTAELLKAMDHDQQLSNSISRLVLLWMHEQLAKTFNRGNWKNRMFITMPLDTEVTK
ncbi:hypothetical protein HJC23_005542 [Cyclotella cryptica]|uniref:Uncharacterized protein n=1 Tax=Cyclotella cryptica TaxID=29204 RepID=A0ABD3PXP3_9STRA|eukprot:CCRYP_010634-RA/>CCRYP_010634-RA protein AED:0.08 eAED:0.12 QI:0/-1/0/1/-1/1/1/0/340